MNSKEYTDLAKQLAEMQRQLSTELRDIKKDIVLLLDAVAKMSSPRLSTYRPEM